MATGGSKRRVLWIHFGLVLATAICVSAFVVELWRAAGGNALSWAYVFEWPLLLGYAVFLWRRLLAEERGEPSRRVAASTPQEAAALEAWNQHLAALHAEDAAAEVQRRGRQAPTAPGRTSASTATSTPLTKRGDASVE